MSSPPFPGVPPSKKPFGGSSGGRPGIISSGGSGSGPSLGGLHSVSATIPPLILFPSLVHLLSSSGLNTRGQLLMAVAQTSGNTFETYNIPTFGIRIQYPLDWGKLDFSFLENNSANIDFYPLDEISGAKVVKIQTDTLPLQNMTLNDYTNIQINSTEEQLLDSNTTVLANLPAHEIVFIDPGIKTMQVWTIKNDKVYTITYTAEEEDFQNDLQIAKMIRVV